MDLEYPRFYYETVASTGIDPVVCGPFGEGLPLGVTVGPEGCTETGSTDRPAQLAAKALAKSSGSARKRPAKKAAAPASKGSGSNESDAVAIPITKATKRANARVPSQTAGAARTARGTAKVASSE